MRSRFTVTLATLTLVFTTHAASEARSAATTNWPTASITQSSTTNWPAAAPQGQR